MFWFLSSFPLECKFYESEDFVCFVHDVFLVSTAVPRHHIVCALYLLNKKHLASLKSLWVDKAENITSLL